MNKTEQTQDTAESQARAQTESIVDMMEALKTAQESGSVEFEGYDYDEDKMREHIDQNALSVEVRNSWHTPGSESTPDEFSILLCTGGPAVRLIGSLSEHCEPERVRVEFQDWGTGWAEWMGITSEQRATVLSYCQLHYFGE